MTREHKAARTTGDGGEIDGVRTGLAEDQIGAARIQNIGIEIAPIGPHNQIAEAITIHIAGTGHTVADRFAGALAIDHEAAAAASDAGEVDGICAGFTEDHIGAAGIAAGGRIGFMGPDDQIGEAIAVDITGTGHAVAALIAGDLAIDHEAAHTSGNRREVDGGVCGAAEDHIGAASVGTGGRIAKRCPHD